MIETERLRREPVTASHASAMFEVLADERIYRYLPSDPPESVEALRKRYEFLSSGRSPDGHPAPVPPTLTYHKEGRTADGSGERRQP